jgi:putative addiction module component (TIGR02574 family)
MSVAAEKVAEILALPEKDRAYLARELIASLDNETDPDAESQWREVIERRTREMREGRVQNLPVEDAVREIRERLHARRQSS